MEAMLFIIFVLLPIVFSIYWCAKLSKQCKDLKNTISQLEEKANSSADGLKAETERNKTLTKDVAELHKTVDRLQQENCALVSNASEMEGKYKELYDTVHNVSDIVEDSKHLNDIDEPAPVAIKAPVTAPPVLEVSTPRVKEPTATTATQGTAIRSSETVLPAQASSELNPEKQRVFSLLEGTNRCFFITGKAGTGKSYLLKYFVKHTRKKLVVAAPTGIAAINAGGVTIHSLFARNLGEDTPISLSENQATMFRTLDTIIIDEASMVRSDIFNRIDLILQYANNNHSPFGGKQIILFGDIFQLPPVAKEKEAEYLINTYGGIYFFNAPGYQAAGFQSYELQEVFRQQDPEFINILNSIRSGVVTDAQIAALNRHVVKEIPPRVTQLVPKRDMAGIINRDKIQAIPGQQEVVYNAIYDIKDNNIMEKDFPCEFTLKLKVGALVLMIVNDANKHWVNGTLGIVSKLRGDGISVTINGTEFDVPRVDFEKKKYTYDREKNKLVCETVASVSQYPVVPAYAITIHKSQGMTYQSVACDLSNCFAAGQGYVALSRCANFDRLYLATPVRKSQFFADPTLTDFYKSIKAAAVI